MNYRGAKVNITGVVTQSELHAAWLQLQQMKMRGSEYFKGSNCHIISAGYGDIINLVGRKEVKKEEKEKKEKIIIKQVVTAYVFVYDEGTIDEYTGFNWVCGVSGNEAAGMYNIVRDSEAPLKKSIKVNGKALKNLDPGSTGGTKNWIDYKVLGPEYYDVSLLFTGQTESVRTNYPLTSFHCQQANLISYIEYLQEYYPGISNDDWYADNWSGPLTFGPPCDYPMYDGDEAYTHYAQGSYYEVEYWYDIHTPGYAGDNEIINSVLTDPDNLTYLLSDNVVTCPEIEYGNYGFTAAQARYPYLIPCDRGFAAEGIIAKLHVPSWETVIVTQSGSGPDITYIKFRTTLTDMTGGWSTILRRIEVPPLVLPMATLPGFGIPWPYEMSNTCTSVVKLDNEILRIYFQGVPLVFRTKVGSSFSPVVYIQINDNILRTESIGAASELTMHQTNIYKVDTTYVCIVSFTAGGTRYNIVFRQTKEGNYEDISAQFDKEFFYLRVAKFQYNIEREL